MLLHPQWWSPACQHDMIFDKTPKITGWLQTFNVGSLFWPTLSILLNPYWTLFNSPSSKHVSEKYSQDGSVCRLKHLNQFIPVLSSCCLWMTLLGSAVSKIEASCIKTGGCASFHLMYQKCKSNFKLQTNTTVKFFRFHRRMTWSTVVKVLRKFNLPTELLSQFCWAVFGSALYLSVNCIIWLSHLTRDETTTKKTPGCWEDYWCSLTDPRGPVLFQSKKKGLEKLEKSFQTFHTSASLICCPLVSTSEHWAPEHPVTGVAFFP